MKPRAIMLQATGSNAGKSTLVAGLCRIAVRRGIAVAPFKPQNMSNNAAACPDGGEIGRAQALQARAAGLTPNVDMNPVLLKPQSDCTSQVVVHGQVSGALEAEDFLRARHAWMGPVLESFERLRDAFELVIVEGAGSAAETNLRHRDIANMGFARRAEVPVCLVAPIDLGGAIAAVVGTREVLNPDDAALITSFVINRFRGDPTLFDAGVREIKQRTGWPCRGVVPWLDAALRLPAEDAPVLDDVRVTSEGGGAALSSGIGGHLRVAAPLFSRIANFDDIDPLRMEPRVDFDFIPPGTPLPRDAHVILLPGTKSTLGELAFVRAQGWDHDIIAHARAGGRVLGLCGGYQMLGRTVCDPEGLDGPPGEEPGLGLLDITTVMEGKKLVRPITGTCAWSGVAFSGYEIHVGRTTGPDCAHPVVRFGQNRLDGATSPNGRVEGCHVHGLFAADAYRAAWLERVCPGTASESSYDTVVEQALDELANGLEAALDVDAMFADARE